MASGRSLKFWFQGVSSTDFRELIMMIMIIMMIWWSWIKVWLVLGVAMVAARLIPIVVRDLLKRLLVHSWAASPAVADRL